MTVPPPEYTIRIATRGDIPTLDLLIPRSARLLSVGYYTEKQIEAAVRYIFGVDTQLVDDGTYFVVTDRGRTIGCGGWSRRRSLYGGDQMRRAPDPLLDPHADAARIRAFFVDPAFARRGIGQLMMRACVAAAAEAGFERLELVATLPGVPLYRRFGFEEIEPFEDVVPDGTRVPVVRMGAPLAAVRARLERTASETSHPAE